MDERYGLVLSGRGTTVEVAGGKAHALDRLIAMGAPVPPSGVLTTAAYRAFVADPLLAAQLAGLREEPLAAIAADDEVRRRVDEMFLAAPIPPPVRAAIDDLVAVVDDGLALLMLGGVARRADLEIGRRLVARGDLPVTEDVELLTFAESAQLLRRRGDAPCVTAALLATRRRRLRSAELNGPLPRRFSGRTAPVGRPVGQAIGRGWGASSGRYEGVARVVIRR